MTSTVQKAIVVGLWSTIISVLIYQFGISERLEKNQAIKKKIDVLEDSIAKAQRQIAQARAFVASVPEVEGRLVAFEKSLLPEDAYLGLVQELEGLREGLEVFVSPTSVPDFASASYAAYQPVMFNITGRGHFFEIGFFIAALENKYPLGMIQSMTLRPLGDSPKSERLHLAVEFVAPGRRVKSQGPVVQTLAQR